jgi:hypothetical protein
LPTDRHPCTPPRLARARRFSLPDDPRDAEKIFFRPKVLELDAAKASLSSPAPQKNRKISLYTSKLFP